MEVALPPRTYPSLCDNCDKYPNLVAGGKHVILANMGIIIINITYFINIGIN